MTQQLQHPSTRQPANRNMSTEDANDSSVSQCCDQSRIELTRDSTMSTAACDETYIAKLRLIYLPLKLLCKPLAITQVKGAEKVACAYSSPPFSAYEHSFGQASCAALEPLLVTCIRHYAQSDSARRVAKSSRPKSLLVRTKSLAFGPALFLPCR